MVFIDLKKAFDTVDRAKLVETMDSRGFDPTIVKAYTKFCENMTLQLPDRSKAITNVGVVQGGVTSPTTFAIIIDPMLRALNEICPSYALADNLVCIVKGEWKLN